VTKPHARVRARRSRHALDVKLRVLVAAVTAAERGEPMPTTAELLEQIGGAPNGIAMAVSALERKGLVKRLNQQGNRMRLMICATGAATAETNP